MKVGDLIRAKYAHDDKFAVILEIPQDFVRPFALVQFAHQVYLTRVFLNNFEVVSESR